MYIKKGNFRYLNIYSILILNYQHLFHDSDTAIASWHQSKRCDSTRIKLEMPGPDLVNLA